VDVQLQKRNRHKLAQKILDRLKATNGLREREFKFNLNKYELNMTSEASDVGEIWEKLLHIVNELHDEDLLKEFVKAFPNKVIRPGPSSSSTTGLNRQIPGCSRNLLLAITAGPAKANKEKVKVEKEKKMPSLKQEESNKRKSSASQKRSSNAKKSRDEERDEPQVKCRMKAKLYDRLSVEFL
jgi:hypothetical protein